MAVWDRESCEAVEALLEERHGEHLREGERFVVSAQDGPEESELCFVLEGGEGGETGERLTLEARAAPSQTAVALDALDMLLGEYFEAGRRLTFEPVWNERTLNGVPLAVRGTRVAPGLEALADTLLNERPPLRS